MEICTCDDSTLIFFCEHLCIVYDVDKKEIMNIIQLPRTQKKDFINSLLFDGHNKKIENYVFVFSKEHRKMLKEIPKLINEQIRKFMNWKTIEKTTAQGFLTKTERSLLMEAEIKRFETAKKEFQIEVEKLLNNGEKYEGV